METILSQRGNTLIIFENFKFRKAEKTQVGLKWRCTQKNCASILFTDEMVSVIIGKC